jgi:23S rRNA (cytosine1962-C5)-methyltransferase
MAQRAIRLASEATSFLLGGGCDVELARINSEPALVAGEVVRLDDSNGDEIGLAIVDPENQKLRVMARPDDGFRKIDGGLIGWRVERAFALRKQLRLADGAKDSQAAYRLLHGAGDLLPGFSCDALGRYGVLYVYSSAMWDLGKQVAQACAGFAKLDGVVCKLRARGGAADVKQEVVGATPPDRYVAEELGVPFEIHPLGGLNAGLFTDMREQRRGLPRFVDGLRVLNLFSYTGALSVAAARGGAASVTSVDTSDGVQAWARGNFARSGLDPKDKRWAFEVGDALRFLARAEKDRERYDMVMIDPPSFSTARGAPWTLDRDYPDMIAKACAVIPAGGLLWLAANNHGLGNAEGSLLRLAQKGFRNAGRHAMVLEQGGLPSDYPTSAAQPKDRYLQIALFRLV